MIGGMVRFTFVRRMGALPENSTSFPRELTARAHPPQRWSSFSRIVNAFFSEMSSFSLFLMDFTAWMTVE